MNTAPSDPADRPAQVLVRRTEAYDLSMNVRLAPASQELLGQGFKFLSCQPRQGAQRQDKDALDLPEPTRQWLHGLSAAVVEWLAKSPENRQAYLSAPLAALQQAGLAADRAHLKAVARVSEAAGTSDAVRPGLQLSRVDSSMTRAVPAEDGGVRRPVHGDCGCGGAVAAGKGRA